MDDLWENLEERRARRFSDPTKLGKQMILCDLQAKLRKVNDLLYVKTDRVNVTGNGRFKLSGIYLKVPKREQRRFKQDSNQIHASHEKYLVALENGELDKFICGVCINHIPEYDIFDFEWSRILAPGWRTIAMKLIGLKLASAEKVKKVFECQSLGEHTYDKLNFFRRLEYAKKLAHGKTQVEEG